MWALFKNKMLLPRRVILLRLQKLKSVFLFVCLFVCLFVFCIAKFNIKIHTNSNTKLLWVVVCEPGEPVGRLTFDRHFFLVFSSLHMLLLLLKSKL